MSSNVKIEANSKDLPKNWKAFHSKKSNKVYYYNTETKKTQWEHPSTGGRAHKPGEDVTSKKPNKKQNAKNNIAPNSTNQKPVTETISLTEKNVQKFKPKIKSEPASVSSGPQSGKHVCSSNVKKRLQPLPPLTKPVPKAEYCNSDGNTSESSERIVAWLEDTSHVNFKEHPVPDIQHEDNERDDKRKLNKLNKVKNEKTKKKVNLDNVMTHESVSRILDCLLPNSGCKGVGKSRYAPYKPSEARGTKRKQGNAGNVKAFEGPSKEIKKANVQPNFTGTPVKIKAENAQVKRNCSNATITKPENINKNSVNNETVRKTIQEQVSTPQQVVNGVNKSGENNNQLFSNVPVQPEEVLAMDAEDEVQNNPSSSFCEDDVADMEIDNAEEIAKEIVERLQQMRNDLAVDPNNVSQNGCEMNIANNGYEGTVYIVLDTNVLLSHLKFVVELKDFPIQGVGLPILVIPWVVIQELDNLKDNKWRSHESESGDSNKVSKLARVAIKFLNSSFQKSDPRVRGQTIDEAAQQVGNLKEESNDDRILQCCLLFQERAESGNCILFSNDNNLCNKALVNGIKAFNHQRLIAGLRDLFQCAAIVKQVCFKEYKVELDVQDELAWRREKADEIICELQIILREGLSYIIETEMREAYDELWQHVVAIKPPWTLVDVLQLLNKHWIAVFGHVLKRDQKTVIDELRTKFDDRKGTPSSLMFATEVLQLGVKLFQAFGAHSNYIDAIPKCLAAVNVLIQKCRQYEAETLNKISTNTNTRQNCPTQRPRATIDEINDNVNTIPHEEVMDTFNLIWTAVTQFSTQIFTALGYPNSLPCETVQELPKASKEDAVQFLGVLCPRLSNLVNSIKNILQDPWEEVSQNDSLFVELERAITVFLQQVLSRDNGLSPQKLFDFCQDSSMRTALVQGLSQLNGASAMLQHCASCVVQPQ